MAGVVNFIDVNKIGILGSYGEINDKFYFQSGIIAHFWMPRTNEKIYFKTGFLYAQLEGTDGEKYDYLKIPTHIGYLAPKTFRVRPSFSIGLLSPSYSGGVAVKINERINLGIQSWVNFNFEKVPLVPTQFLNYSILGNLYIEL